MYNLLTAGFIRLIKSWYFWCVFALVSLMNIYFGMVNRKQIINLYQGQMPGSVLFSHTIFLGIAVAILIGLYIGDEYSYRTIRNKMITGMSRVTIYFSYFIVVFVAIVSCHLSAILVGYLYGRICIGTLTISFSLLIKHTVYSLFAIAAMCAISLCIVTLVQNKAVGCGVANCIATVCTFGGSGLVNMMIIKEFPVTVWVDFLPEAYLSKIRSYEDLFVNECLTDISLPIGSLCICLLFLGIGVSAFAYKDIG